MRAPIWILCLLPSALAGCSGGEDSQPSTTTGSDGATTAASTTASGATGSGGHTSDGSTSTTSGAGGTDSTGTGATAHDHVTYAMSFEVPTGGESLMCKYFPPNSKDMWIQATQTIASAGGHHMNLFRVPATDAPTETGAFNCTNEFPQADGMFPCGLNKSFIMPEGVAIQLPKDHGVVLQAHFINTTAQPLAAQASWTGSTEDASQVQYEAGGLFFSIGKINAPPGMSTTSQTCPAPVDMKFFWAGGHYHDHGAIFKATVGGQTMLDISYKDDLVKEIDPVMPVKAGDPITWACTYDNDTGAPLHYGLSVTANEMCLLEAFAYPVPNSQTYFACKQSP